MSSIKKIQFPPFFDNFLFSVKSKLATKTEAILDDVTGSQQGRNPKYIAHLVEHITGFLLKVKYFRNIVT